MSIGVKLKRISALLVFAMIVSIFPTAIFAAETEGASSNAALTDIGASYAKKEIEALVQQGILSGFGNGTFKPAQSMTRAELAKVIVLSKGLEVNAGGAAAFADVKEGDWFAGYVGALVDSGITQGTSATTFSPNNKVTREELAVFFVRAFGWADQAESVASENGLADFDQVSDWAKSSVNMAFGIGFLKGIETSGGALKFDPKGAADRQALARLAYEFINNSEHYATELEALLAGQETAPVTPVNPDKTESSKGSKDKDDDDDKDNGSSNPEPSEPTVTIDEAGEYELGEVDGSVTINVPDVTLINTVISGDLVLGEGVGQGDVTLNGVTVEGQTFVYGGGVNSIHVQDSVLATVIVNKADGSIRLVLESGTEVQQVTLRSGAVLETVEGVGSVGDVTISDSLPQNASVTLNGTFDNVLVHAAQAQVTVPEGSSIGNLHVFAAAIGTVFHLEEGAHVTSAIVDAIVSFLGQGEIESCLLNANGTSFEREPNRYAADASVIDAVYTPESVTMSAVEATYQISVAGITESESDYKNITAVTSWSSSDESVVEVSGGLLTSKGEGQAFIEGVYGDFLISVPVTVSVYNHPSIENYPVISGIEVTNGEIKVEFAGDVEGESMADFIVSATLDGLPVELEGLQYDSGTDTFTFDPVDSYGRTLYVTIEADANKSKFAGSQSGSFRLTGFGGKIIDVNRNPVSGLEIKFRKGLNATEGEIAGIARTDENGRYFIYLEPGIYTGELGGEGTAYVTTYLIGVAANNVKNESENQTAIGIPAASETRIVLTWGKDPADLDSHLIGPAVGEGQFHTWYGVKSYSTADGLVVDLDLDDVTSYGPETTTIRQDVDGTYKFYVHHFSGSATLKTSGAKIEVYRGATSEPAQVYEVPAGSGDERYWIVFEMVVEDGQATFTTINEFTNVSPASGAYANDYYNYPDYEGEDQAGEETDNATEAETVE